MNASEGRLWFAYKARISTPIAVTFVFYERKINGGITNVESDE